MQKPSLIKPFLIVCLLLTVSFKTYSQVDITPAAIRKIVISDGASGLGGGAFVSVEVLRENSQWISYQTDYTVHTQFGQPVANLINKRKKIGLVPDIYIANLTNGLRQIKSKFDPNTFGITPAMLKAGLQFKKTASPNDPDFDQLVTPETIAAAIDKAAKYEFMAMDYGAYHNIYIIKNIGDTIKLKSDSYQFGLLPWTLNKQDTYDIAITQFFQVALGKELFSGKDDLIDMTWYALGVYNPRLLHYRWEHGYPDNKDLLQNQYGFHIKEANLIGPYPPNEYSETVRCVFTNRDLLPNILINCDADISNMTWIKKMADFKKTMLHLQNTDSFFFKYYSAIPGAEISVVMPNRQYSGPGGGMDLYKQIPEAEQYYREQYINIYTKTPYGTMLWWMMPDGRLISDVIAWDTKPQALPPQILKEINFQQVKQDKKFKLYSTTGKKLR